MGRAPCCDKTKVKRGGWSPEEDSILKDYLHHHGTAGNWIALPAKAGLRRCGKSCRLRWLNYLRPDINHGGFSDQEDNIILSMYSSLGSRWSIIASQLSGRTDNDVKNHWNTKLKKKLLQSKTTHHDHINDFNTNMSTSRPMNNTNVTPNLETTHSNLDHLSFLASSNYPNNPSLHDHPQNLALLFDHPITNYQFELAYFNNLIFQPHEANLSLSTSSSMTQIPDNIDYKTCLNNLSHSNDFHFQGNIITEDATWDHTKFY